VQSGAMASLYHGHALAFFSAEPDNALPPLAKGAGSK